MQKQEVLTRLKTVKIDLETYNLLQQIEKVTKVPKREIIKIAVNSIIYKEKISIPKIRPKWNKLLLEFVKLCYAWFPNGFPDHLRNYASSLKNRCYKAILEEIEDVETVKYLLNFINELWEYCKQDYSKILYEQLRHLEITEYLDLKNEKHKIAYSFLQNRSIKNLINFKDKLKDLKTKIGNFKIVYESIVYESYTEKSAKDFAIFILLNSKHESILKHIKILNEKYGFDFKTLNDCLSCGPMEMFFASKRQDKTTFIKIANNLKKDLRNIIEELENGKIPKRFSEKINEETIKDIVLQWIDFIYDLTHLPFPNELYNEIVDYLKQLKRKNENSWINRVYLSKKDFAYIKKKFKLDLQTI